MTSTATAIPSSNQRGQKSIVQRSASSWGRYPRAEHANVHRVAWADQVPAVLDAARPHGLLPYGLGRSYGDSCLNDGGDLLDCSILDRFLAADFADSKSGWIRCEAGISLAEMLKVIVPRGFFLPVTPGTKFVTLGGAIANDVHGKNHHAAGTLGRYVRKLALCRSDEGVVICSPEENAGLFRATIGGLGLTGVIVWAEIQLTPITGSDLELETLPFRSIEEFMALTAESDQKFQYTVAWIDSLSGKQNRGIFFRGNHANSSRFQSAPSFSPKLAFPLPQWTLNRFSVRAFNQLYFSLKNWKRGMSLEPYEPFFYPLDSIRQWNLMYGKRGFLQYQCVLPEPAEAALRKILDTVSKSGKSSFLSVLKKFGSLSSPGLLSFPRPGLTLTLDFAMRGQSTLALLKSLDEIVLESGGALYPAKDARMSPAMFQASFPNWRDMLPCIDPKLSSSFWRRVTGSLPL